MKRLAFLLFISGISWNLNAQDLKKIEGQYKPITVPDPNMDPMTGRAFNKFLIDHFSYTILGSTGPATGLKVETASPSISLKGTLFKSNKNSQIVTLELQAGADSKLMQVFSENKWSNYFKATVGYNVLIGPGKLFKTIKHPFKNKAKFDIKNEYLIYNYRNAGVVMYQALVRQGQKTSVIKGLLNELFMKKPDAVTLSTLINDADLNIDCPKVLPENKYTLLEILAKEVMKDYGMKFPEEASFNICLDLFAKNWKDHTTDLERKQKFLKDYEKQASIKTKAVDSLYRYEIELVKDNYTSKTVWWFNASPFIGSTSFKEYTLKPATLSDNSSIVFGTKLSLNYF